MEEAGPEYRLGQGPKSIAPAADLLFDETETFISRATGYLRQCRLVSQEANDAVKKLTKFGVEKNLTCVLLAESNRCLTNSRAQVCP